MTTLRKETKFIVWHCTATNPNVPAGAAQIDYWHRQQGWDGIGYHIVIRRDGTIEYGRSLNAIGAHVKWYNINSVGIVWEGGLADTGEPTDNRTSEQKEAMRRVAIAMQNLFPEAVHVGHRDLSPDLNGDGKITQNEWLKECPCFDVKEWFNEVNI